MGTTVGSFVLLLATWRNISYRLVVIQVLFDLLSFPLMQKLAGVFSCTSSSTWVKSNDSTLCAPEGGTCKCSGGVRYEAEGHWSDWQAVIGSIACDNTAFGDPYNGERKICQCHGESALFCDSHVAADQQCMGDDPSTQCWTQKHLIFVVTVMLILAPYFFCTLGLQATAQGEHHAASRSLSLPPLFLKLS